MTSQHTDHGKSQTSGRSDHRLSEASITLLIHGIPTKHPFPECSRNKPTPIATKAPFLGGPGKPSLDTVQRKCSAFGNNGDIQIRATLYSLITNNVQDAKATMQSIRESVRSFNCQSVAMFQDSERKC